MYTPVLLDGVAGAFWIASRVLEAFVASDGRRKVCVAPLTRFRDLLRYCVN